MSWWHRRAQPDDLDPRRGRGWGRAAASSRPEDSESSQLESQSWFISVSTGERKDHQVQVTDHQVQAQADTASVASDEVTSTSVRLVAGGPGPATVGLVTQ